jgi:hypothetical protein
VSYRSLTSQYKRPAINEKQLFFGGAVIRRRLSLTFCVHKKYMREQKLIDEYFSDYKARTMDRLRELERTGQLESRTRQLVMLNGLVRAAGGTDAGFHNVGNDI